MDHFIIERINTERAANKAQEYVIEKLKELSLIYKTVTNEKDLDDLENKIKEFVLEAHERFPRCKKLSVSKSINLDNGYNIYVSTQNGFLAFLRVIEIKENWKNK